MDLGKRCGGPRPPPKCFRRLPGAAVVPRDWEQPSRQEIIADICEDRAQVGDGGVSRRGAVAAGIIGIELIRV